MIVSASATSNHQAPGLLDRERIVAKAGFNRWLVPLAALAIHLCIGISYGLSAFWLPLAQALDSEAAIAEYLAVSGARPSGVGFEPARINPRTFALDEPHGHGRPYDTLDDVTQDIALQKASEPGSLRTSS